MNSNYSMERSIHTDKYIIIRLDLVGWNIIKEHCLKSQCYFNYSLYCAYTNSNLLDYPEQPFILFLPKEVSKAERHIIHTYANTNLSIYSKGDEPNRILRIRPNRKFIKILTKKYSP